MFQEIANKYNVLKENISYSNDEEYRNALCCVFFLTSSDDEFDDENNKKLIETMEHLFHLTEKNEIFDKLYNLACSKMFLTDKTIGQCILYSYDYFDLFHYCMCLFLKGGEMSEEEPQVKALFDKLNSK